MTTWYLFGPCRDGMHDECLVRFRDPKTGELKTACSCECGHKAQDERELAIPA